MELLKLPPNLQFYPAKLKLNPQFLCRKTQRLSVQSALKKLRVRSEFNGKSNGALSGDTDPRLIDRAVRPLMAEGITQASPYNARYPTLPEQEEEFFEEVQ
ncbi:unnamed protein product [Amaranthus hypochondriacus]